MQLENNLQQRSPERFQIVTETRSYWQFLVSGRELISARQQLKLSRVNDAQKNIKNQEFRAF